uniref:Uncharacterized protein n=1 Tax=Oryza punctata TaxID=4537 RepID=A0A0E0LBI9_ORYPU
MIFMPCSFSGEMEVQIGIGNSLGGNRRKKIVGLWFLGTNKFPKLKENLRLINHQCFKRLIFPGASSSSSKVHQPGILPISIATVIPGTFKPPLKINEGSSSILKCLPSSVPAGPPPISINNLAVQLVNSNMGLCTLFFSPFHVATSCKSTPRCWASFKYEHLNRPCWSKSKGPAHWRQKTQESSDNGKNIVVKTSTPSPSLFSPPILPSLRNTVP